MNEVVHFSLVIGNVETQENEQLSKTHLMELNLVDLVIEIQFGAITVYRLPLLLDRDNPVIILLTLEIEEIELITL
jgi:hypothetical protein